MKIRNMIQRMGQYDEIASQGKLVISILLVALGMMVSLLIYPSMRYQDLLAKRLEETKERHQYQKQLLAQKEQWRKRFGEMSGSLAQSGVSCAWRRGEKVDTVELTFGEVQACLQGWIQASKKVISEITLYKKNQVKVLEVMHD